MAAVSAWVRRMLAVLARVMDGYPPEVAGRGVTAGQQPGDDDDPGDLVQGREGVEHVPVVLGDAAKAAMGVGGEHEHAQGPAGLGSHGQTKSAGLGVGPRVGVVVGVVAGAGLGPLSSVVVGAVLRS